jgi:dTDP-glucose 4,6-dehydratase
VTVRLPTREGSPHPTHPDPWANVARIDGRRWGWREVELSGARVVVTGGAGFLGSHLCEALIERGAEVICVDNFITGAEDNVAHLFGHERFTIVAHDVTEYLVVPGHVDAILHFASPASPIDYLKLPIQTLKVGALGTHKALGLARAKGSRFMLASTSEVYGDPQVHPQPESYWGHVNPVGPRGVYDEAKRYAEALTFAYHRTHGIEVRVARIFNTYGPRMRLEDGRAVPTFVNQALAGDDVTLHGGGDQTRSLCFVDDLVRGLLALLTSDTTGPVNIGNPHEVTVRELAETIIELSGSGSRLIDTPRPEDDPQVRQPDTTVAARDLGWKAEIELREGLSRTIDWVRAQGGG